MTVHEKRCAFMFIFRSQTISIRTSSEDVSFPQLDADYAMFHECKTTKTFISPGGASKTKNSTTAGHNQVQRSTNMQNIKPKLDNKTSSSKEQQSLTCKSDLIDFRSKSLI